MTMKLTEAQATLLRLVRLCNGWIEMVEAYGIVRGLRFVRATIAAEQVAGRLTERRLIGWSGPYVTACGERWLQTTPQLVTHAVRGAPFQVGDRVRVILTCDAEANTRRVGQIGEVIGLWYGRGCGEVFPGMPLLSVRFPRSQRGSRIAEFWPEELRPAGSGT